MAKAHDVAAVLKAADGGISKDRYASWRGVAKALLDAGYTRVESAAIMLSKYTRWAADHSDKPYGRATGPDVLEYLARSRFTISSARELVDGTFTAEERRTINVGRG